MPLLSFSERQHSVGLYKNRLGDNDNDIKLFLLDLMNTVAIDEKSTVRRIE